MLRVDGKWMSIKIPVHTCPKTGQKLLSSLIFYVKTRHFLLLFAIICIQMACFKKVKELRGISGLTHALRSALHWFHPRKSLTF